MNIDERIEALQASIAKHHEMALVQGVNIESLHSSLEELHDDIAELKKRTTELYATAVQDGINIRTLAESIGNLARIAESQGNRNTNLEGGSPNIQ